MSEQILKGNKLRAVFSNIRVEHRLKGGITESLFVDSGLLCADVIIKYNNQHNKPEHRAMEYRVKALIMTPRYIENIPVNDLNIPLLLVPPYADQRKTADMIIENALEGLALTDTDKPIIEMPERYIFFISPADKELKNKNILVNNPYEYVPIIEKPYCRQLLLFDNTDSPNMQYAF